MASTLSGCQPEETGILTSWELALQNDLVLEKVFSHLCLPDLKSCRLVNHQWKRVSLPTCAKRCKEVSFDGKYPHYRSYNLPAELNSFNQLISSSTPPSTFPCTKFCVDFTVMKDDFLPNQKSILVNFFHLIGPFVEELDIEGIGKRLLFQEPPEAMQFPRLKVLKIDDLEFVSPEVLPGNMTFCKNIIQNAAEFQTLELFIENPNTLNLFIALLGPEQNIKCLDLSTKSLKASHFKKMAESGQKLRRLWLCFRYKSDISQIGNGLEKFLKSQSGSLKELHLLHETSGEEPQEELLLNFPKLPKLTHLNLQIQRGIRYGRISYVEMFPALQSLSILGFPKREMDTFFYFRLRPVVTLTALEMPWNVEDPAWIWQAARIFPNVKRLGISTIEPQVMRAVFEAWHNVEELKLMDAEGLMEQDELLSGYPTEMLKDIEEVFPDLRPLVERNLVQPAEFLQNLKVLKVHEECYGAIDISEHFCRLVLLKLRSLHCLDLREWGSCDLSEDVLQEMRAKFNVLHQIESDDDDD